MKKLATFLFTLVLALPLTAKVELPSIFSDGMVLQQNENVAFWGKSDGKKVAVSVSWSKKKLSVTPDSDGKWFLRVPTPSAGGPYEITFNDGEKLTLRNVLIGEVWFCSGQSNMEMPLRGFEGQPVEHGMEYIVGAKPQVPIRICNIPNKKSLAPILSTEGVWKENRPENVGNISAVAYFFACRLHAVLDIPIGIIVCDWGGSAIEAWIRRDILERDFPGEFDTSILDGGEISERRVGNPCILYNGMVSPLIPFTFKGIIWYQGETNRGRPEQYTRLQPAYVKMMRELFQNPEAPFYFTQIAPYPYGQYGGLFTSGYFYEAQQKCLELIPHSGMAATVDVGSYYTIHPPKKKEIGDRLAYLALVNDYGLKGVNPVSPTYKSVEFSGADAIVTFETDALGLAPRKTPLEGFELAGEDRVFHPATAIADKNTVTVSSEKVPAPVAVRYCFRNWGQGSLFNAFGIPALPFRTDSWDDLKE